MAGWVDRRVDSVRIFLQRLSTAMQVLLLLAIALISVSLLWLSSALPTNTFSEFLNAVATGILVSAGFAFAQQTITGHVTFDLLRRGVSDQIRDSLVQLNDTFVPTHDFRATDQPEPNLNRVLMDDLNESQRFWFKGMSARHTADRIMRQSNGRLEVRIIMPDLTIPESLDARANYMRRYKMAGASRDSIKQGIVVGLVGLYEARDRCAKIEIFLTPTPSLDRIEMFDRSVWISLFSSLSGGGTRYPRTLRFAEKSLLRQTSHEEFFLTMEASNVRRIEITPRTSRNQFSDIYRVATGEELTTEVFNSNLASFNSFRDPIAPRPDGKPTS